MVNSLYVVPLQGETLLDQTKTDWLLGQMFKVVDSTNTLFRRNQRITRDDLAFVFGGDKYEITFKHQTVAEYTAQQEAY